MNKRRLAAIARWLEAGAPEKKHVIGFNMNHGIVFNKLKETPKKTYACGSTCCIAGAAVSFFNNPVKMLENEFQYMDHHMKALSFLGGIKPEAMELLDLKYHEASRLFEPEVLNADWSSITPAWAARCIRKLIKTGEVDWQGTKKG